MSNERLELREASVLAEAHPLMRAEALFPAGNPIVALPFLGLMEATSVLEAQGWEPLHQLLTEADQVRGLLPSYVKRDSIGEFGSDWNWADAYHRSGRRYFPKLVSAIPFTPVSGPRFLVGPGGDAASVQALAEQAKAVVNEHGWSSWHGLFITESEYHQLSGCELLGRHGVQFHWFNRGYQDFDDFLNHLNAKRRKEIRRERRQAEASGLRFRVADGHTASLEDWAAFHRFYCSTFERKWGEPRFTLDYFLALARTQAERTLLFLADGSDGPVAGAFALLGDDCLYGRHWGCDQFHSQLHFELCYYQTIEYCIQHRLPRLDAGAQGEHKLARGFEPVFTHSVHYIREHDFRVAVADYLVREAAGIEQYVHEIQAHSPYRHAPEH